MNVRTMHNKENNTLSKVLIQTLVTIGYITALIIQSAPLVYAATSLTNRYDKVSSSNLSANTTHSIGFTYTDFTSSVGSVSMEFCSNSPISGDACSAPAGFSASSATLASQSGETGFSIDPSSTVNKLILTRAFSVPSSGASVYNFTNVVNPSSPGTYFVRLASFASNNATGISIQEGGIAISVNGPLSVVSEVPPFLRFCVGVTVVSFDCNTASSFFIDFGELSTSRTSTASAQMVAVTNAEFGYSITLDGTTLTSGNRTIAALTTPTSSNVGTSQFGINLRENTQPAMGANPVGPGTASPTANYNIPNKFKFVRGEFVATGIVSQDYKKYTMTYIANIGTGQAPGVYATTLTMICLANF